MIKEKYLFCDNGFLIGFLSGITSIGLLYPSKFSPRRYQGSFQDDLQAIGSDMWNAIERGKIESKEEKAT